MTTLKQPSPIHVPSHRVLVVVALAAAISPLRAAAPPVLTVAGVGQVAHEISADEFAQIPRTPVSWTVHGKTLKCEGPWLTEVLARAGAPTGAALQGSALTQIVVATAMDGYKVGFTLGELDHGLGNAPVIVADRCDGKPIGQEDGPPPCRSQR